MKSILVIAINLGLLLADQAYSEIFGFFNFTKEHLSVRLKKTGSYYIQLMKTEGSSEYLKCDKRTSLSEAACFDLDPDGAIFFNIDYNFEEHSMPEFAVVNGEGKDFEYTLSMHPNKITGEFRRNDSDGSITSAIDVSQDFGSQQLERVQETFDSQRITKSIEKMRQTYMAIVLEPATKSSQGIEKEKASTQESSSTQEEDVNNDGAENKTVNKKTKKTMSKNMTDEQPVVPCCLIY